MTAAGPSQAGARAAAGIALGGFGLLWSALTWVQRWRSFPARMTRLNRKMARRS
jgi:hypothetical protein